MIIVKWVTKRYIISLSGMIRIAIVLMVVLAGCSRPEEAPVFKKVNNLRVAEVKGTEALLKADAYFYNPNKVNMKLKKVEIDVEVEGKKVGVVKHNVSTKIPAMSEFKVPVDATFSLKEAGLLKSVLSILGGKKLKVRYSGFIKVSVHGVPIRVPVDYEGEVKLK